MGSKNFGAHEEIGDYFSLQCFFRHAFGCNYIRLVCYAVLYGKMWDLKISVRMRRLLGIVAGWEVNCRCWRELGLVIS